MRENRTALSWDHKPVIEDRMSPATSLQSHLILQYAYQKPYDSSMVLGCWIPLASWKTEDASVNEISFDDRKLKSRLFMLWEQVDRSRRQSSSDPGCKGIFKFMCKKRCGLLPVCERHGCEGPSTTFKVGINTLLLYWIAACIWCKDPSTK